MIGEAEAESLKLKAKAYVDQREVIAKGFAPVMDEFRHSFKGVSDQEILALLAGIDWRDVARSSKTIIIPADMSSANVSQTVAIASALTPNSNKEVQSNVTSSESEEGPESQDLKQKK